MIDLDRITRELNRFWDTFAPIVIFCVGLAALLLSIMAARAALTTWRRSNLNAKAVIALALVQAGVTYIVISGVFEFFHRLLHMPTIEAIVLAVFAEAVTWAAVGFIYAHGRGKRPDGTPNRGFGDAGGLFWISVVGGGTLAVLGSSTTSVAIGRLVIVSFGAAMWYLQLLRATTRSTARSRFRWTPRRLLLAIGALAPEDDDITDEAHEWQVRRLARSLRWANSRAPLCWMGRAALIRRAESTSEPILNDARRRYAAAHLLVRHARPDSPVMAEILTSLEDEQTGRLHAQRRELAALHDQVTRLSTDLESQRTTSATLTEQLERLTNRLSALDAERSRLATELDSQRALSARLTADVDRLTKNLSTADTERARLIRSLAERDTEVDRLSQILARAHASGRTHPRVGPGHSTSAQPNGSTGPSATTPAAAPAPPPTDDDSTSTTTKDHVFALLDQEAAAGRLAGTKEMAERILPKVGGRLDTVKRYVRDWRNAREQRTTPHTSSDPDQPAPVPAGT